jgi:hypothetical protein
MGRGDGGGVWLIDINRWQLQIGMVQGVENLPPKLKVAPLPHGEIPEQRQVDGNRAWPVQDISADAFRYSSARLLRERSFPKPLLFILRRLRQGMPARLDALSSLDESLSGLRRAAAAPALMLGAVGYPAPVSCPEATTRYPGTLPTHYTGV